MADPLPPPPPMKDTPAAPWTCLTVLYTLTDLNFHSKMTLSYVKSTQVNETGTSSVSEIASSHNMLKHIL